MAIKSIEVRNLLSFDTLIINNITDINCIVGKNNTGKSNLLKLIHFFYNQLEGKRELPPELNSNYSAYGSISIEYDTSRIRKIVASDKDNKTAFFTHIYNTLFKRDEDGYHSALKTLDSKKTTYTLTLTINKNDSLEWSTKNRDILKVINYLYPFFEIQTRHIDLYDWDKLWFLISRLKSFKVDKLRSDEIIDFFNKRLSGDSDSYIDYVDKVQNITNTSKYSYREKVLNYVKIGLKGQTFMIEGEDLKIQSDGTNSFTYVAIFLDLLISLTRRDFITPSVFIDEPEVGLHPKLNERLITRLYKTYTSFRRENKWEKGKYSTPYPNIFLSTHSPNIVKTIIKSFSDDHNIFHFSKNRNDNTIIKKMNSQYKDKRFLNIFSDNEARLFFSEFIIFVEGETEVELLQNSKLHSKFSHLEKVDIYKTNLVQLNGVSPEFSNAAIPYLVLYDLDKLISININKRTIKVLHQNINLKNYLEKYKRSYYRSPEYKLKQNISKLLTSVDGSNINLDDNNLFVTSIEGANNVNIEKLADFINSEILLPHNYMTLPTTIEGTLINTYSIPLLEKWISFEIYKNHNIRQIAKPEKRIEALSKKTNLNDLNDVKSAIIAILEPSHQETKLTRPSRKFVHNIKKSYLNLLHTELHNSFKNPEDSLTALRLIFNGKSNSLVSLENTNKKFINKDYINKVNAFKDHLKPLEYLFGKTSGWVTMFLDFSITHIEKTTQEDRFNYTFKTHFPELHVIISRLQP
jgi:predicted ATP-dependent endonuclease of OLD family